MMKDRNPIKDFFSFDHATAKGYVIVVSLFAIAIAVYFILPQWVSAPLATKPSAELISQWQLLKENAKNYEGQKSKRYATNFGSKELTPFPFDPNTVDSAALIKMGLPHYTVNKLLNWRRHGKIFKSKEDLKELYTLKSEQYEALKPYIHIDATFIKQNQPKAKYDLPKQAPQIIDINTTDATTLALLWGIGDFTANKIMERRNALGGFYKLEQLKEAWKFNDTVYKILERTLVFEQRAIRKIRLNVATLEQLAAHPYIGDKTAKNILIYREGIKSYKSISELRQVPLMNEEIYRKIAPYLSLD